MRAALKWLWSWWCSWPDVIPLCTLCYVPFTTLLGLTYFWPASIPFFLHVSSLRGGDMHITCNSPSQFQVPCFLSISHLFRTQLVIPLVRLIWPQFATLSPAHAHHFQHAVFYCHCNTPAPFWLLVLLPLHSCIACSSWTNYTFQWRQHDHWKCEDPSISECSAIYRRFESSQLICFNDCHYDACCRRNGSMIWRTCQMS